MANSTLLRKLALCTASTLLALAGAELVVRWSGLAPPVKIIALEDERSVYRRSSNPILGFELKASYRNPDADLRQSYPSTNAYGQRDVERAIGQNNVAEGLEQLAELSRLHGFEPVVVVWPVFRDEEIVDAYVMTDDASELIVEYLARRNGIPVFRMSDAFRQAMARAASPVNPRLAYTVGDGLHPSSLGNRVAAQAIRQALERLPESGDRPAVREDAERYETARHAAAAAGSSNPDYSRVYNNIGVDLLAQGKLDEAIAEFRKATEADPQSAEGHANLGNAYRVQGRLDEAIRHYRVAVRVAPDRAEARFNLGLALDQAGRTDEAVEQLRRSLEIKPGQVPVECGLARALVRTGRTDEALDVYRRALERAPDAGVLHRELAGVFVVLQRPDQARPHLERAAELERRDP